MRRFERWRAFDRRLPWVADALLAAALGALMVSDGLQAQFVDAHEYRYVLALVAGLYAALAVRRVAPLVCMAAQLALLAALTGVGTVALDAYVPVAVGVFSITAYRRGWWHAGAAVVAMALGATNGLGQQGFSVLAVGLGWYSMLLVAAGWAFGLAARQRQAAVAALEDRTRRLEIEAAQQAALGAAAERERIAREMHDVIAHSLTVIVAQADGGRYVAERDPAAARGALAAIGDAARRALADTRSMLGVLRDPQGGEAPLAPQAGVDGLADLLTQARSSGLDIVFEERGDAADVPGPVSLALYRAAQECITNVLRHAGVHAPARLALVWEPDRVTLEAVNGPASRANAGISAGTGPSRTLATAGSGLGLAGMAERAASLGGTLEHGPTPDGGFRVLLTLPLGGTPA
ncbi:sensor histidine kinase [Demequina pelophila]|uniref:sensor histidine kinase n=1 Tax=Demequina pelophila TaxID=1638984 RepID=UPI0007836EE5|nr:histidine kinase [Demequina pelophila]